MADGKKSFIRSEHAPFFFSKKEKGFIVHAIASAELKTSAEFRVHTVSRVKEDVLIEAQKTFEKIGMANTALRNGVMIFFAIKNRQFAIIGDKGIHEKMGKQGWENIASRMEEMFKENDFASGIAYGIEQIGDVLKKHFPRAKDDINELPDEISFG